MITTLPFNGHVADYEAWFEKYPFVFQSEVEAIRDMLPEGSNLYAIEIGAGTGRFAKELGIREGIEPAANMRALALKRGINVLAGEADHLPFEDMKYDFVLMAFCISYFENLQKAFKESYRVLKNGGSLIVGFVDKASTIGKSYEEKRSQSVFYREARFYSTKTVATELRKAGFKDLDFSQTLFHALDYIKEFEPAEPGFGKGSFIVIRAIK
ncbi:MAG TPA: class I SAM-dependent methyltransferase [Chitinophagaceae bacterium]